MGNVFSNAGGDAVGERSIEDIATIILEAARALNFERRGVRSLLLKKPKEHIDTEKELDRTRRRRM